MENQKTSMLLNNFVIEEIKEDFLLKLDRYYETKIGKMGMALAFLSIFALGFKGVNPVFWAVGFTALIAINVIMYKITQSNHNKEMEKEKMDSILLNDLKERVERMSLKG